MGIDYISNLETKGSNIKIDTLEKIITALNITPSELFESRITPQNPQLELLADQLAQLPQTSQEQLIEAFQLLIKTVKKQPLKNLSGYFFIIFFPYSTQIYCEMNNAPSPCNIQN